MALKLTPVNRRPTTSLLLRSRIVLTQASPLIEDGAIVVKKGRIVAVGRYRDFSSFSVEEQIDLGEQILLPGFINAHCHLDYTGMQGKLSPKETFSQWIQDIIALKKLQTQEEYISAIEKGQKELRQWGCTSVLNIGAIPGIIEKLSTPLLRTWWFHELIDIAFPIDLEALILKLSEFFQKERSEDWRGGFGLAPHAPYAVSRKLYEDIQFYTKKVKIPVTTHLAETTEELEMFRDGSGPLFDFIKSLGRCMKDCKTKSPVGILLGEGLLPRGSILAHLNALEETDWQILQQVGSGFTAVHCPKTHAYFGRDKFHFKRLQETGISICLGTDSLASNNSLNLFEEMRLFLHTQEGCSDEREVLDMVTLHAARAIGWEGYLGQLTIGACADCIAIPFSGKIEETISAIVNHTQPVEWITALGEL